MEIHGPLNIRIAEATQETGRELHIDFRPEFRSLSLADQGKQFRAYLSMLGNDIKDCADDDPNRAGMLLVQQIVEELLPHVEGGDMALGDTIIIEIGGPPAVSLVDLLS